MSFPSFIAVRAWRSTVSVRARPEAVLDALTDPDACARWSGIPFTVHGLRGTRLAAGSTARVSGELVGRRLDFDVTILEANPRRLRLRATGPVELAATYALVPALDGCLVEADVSVRPAAALSGPAMALATNVLLSAGALPHALCRLAAEAESDLLDQRSAA